MQIDQIMQLGFNPDGIDSGDEYRGLAFLSLRIALKAFFSTYRSINHLKKIEYDELKGMIKENKPNSICCKAYQEAYTEAIIHFQHFIELIMKDLLKEKHIFLIVDDTKKCKTKILYKLLTGQTLTDDEEKDTKDISFNDSLKRLSELTTDDVFDPQVKVIVESHKIDIDRINDLRNKLLHRGRFILPYNALDWLFGKTVLPLILKITSIPRYSSQGKEWKYRRLECDIDPINEIIKECSKNSIDAKKIALLKELARAAYENPLNDMRPYQADDADDAERQLYSSENEEIKTKYEAYSGVDISILKADHGDYIGRIDIKECLVCGLKTMIIHDWGDGKVPIFVNSPNVDVSCRCCSFEIHNNLSNPKKYGYSIEDFWSYED